ncbi:hypothetical protein [Maritimibacter sp. 55A14]|uniref:hypothetical protein n=1 Tax=Maritimibacter sp. 55A14 TaxID=2174844 RepID=UPI0013048E19|nr:hypothetical protein [Maritimibacter sp. 55A14]
MQAFRALNCGPALSMTGITPVRGPQAHPCRAWLREAHDFTPGWNGAGRPR